FWLPVQFRLAGAVPQTSVWAPPQIPQGTQVMVNPSNPDVRPGPWTAVSATVTQYYPYPVSLSTYQQAGTTWDFFEQWQFNGQWNAQGLCQAIQGQSNGTTVMGWTG